jgi:CHASE3 domain sensor protein
MTKFKQIPISQQVLFAFAAFCAVLVMMVALFFFSLRAIEHRRQTQQAIAHHKWEVIDQLPGNIGLMQTGVFQHLLATNVVEMRRRDQTIHEFVEANSRILAGYEALMDNEEERRHYAQVQQARKEYLERTEEVLVLSRAHRNAEAAELALAKQGPAYVHYHAVVGELIEDAREDARQSRAGTSRLIGHLGQGGGILIGLAMLVIVGQASPS